MSHSLRQNSAEHRQSPGRLPRAATAAQCDFCAFDVAPSAAQSLSEKLAKLPFHGRCWRLLGRNISQRRCCQPGRYICRRSWLADFIARLLLQHCNEPRSDLIECPENRLELSFRHGFKRNRQIPGEVFQCIRIRLRRLSNLQKCEAINDETCGPVVGIWISWHTANADMFHRPDRQAVSRDPGKIFPDLVQYLSQTANFRGETIDGFSNLFGLLHGIGRWCFSSLRHGVRKMPQFSRPCQFSGGWPPVR